MVGGWEGGSYFGYTGSVIGNSGAGYDELAGRTLEIVAGVSIILIGLAKVVGGIIIIGAAEAEAATLVGIVLLPHTMGLGGVLVSSGIGTIGFGLYLVYEALSRERAPNRKGR